MSKDFEELMQDIDEFCIQRDWQKFHTLKNLSMALSVEAAELLEIYQWDLVDNSIEPLSEKKRSATMNEVADIFIYLSRFCSVSGIDLKEAVEKKLRINGEKYPAELVRGSSKKYTDY